MTSSSGPWEIIYGEFQSGIGIVGTNYNAGFTWQRRAAINFYNVSRVTGVTVVFDWSKGHFLSPGGGVGILINIGGHTKQLYPLEMPDNMTDYTVNHTIDHEVEGDITVFIRSSDTNLGIYGSILIKSITIDGRADNPFT